MSIAIGFPQTNLAFGTKWGGTIKSAQPLLYICFGENLKGQKDCCFVFVKSLTVAAIGILNYNVTWRIIQNCFAGINRVKFYAHQNCKCICKTTICTAANIIYLCSLSAKNRRWFSWWSFLLYEYCPILCGVFIIACQSNLFGEPIRLLKGSVSGHFLPPYFS